MISQLLTFVAAAAAPIQGGTAGEAESRLAMQDYAACVVKGSPEKAAALLAKDFTTAEYQAELRALAMGNRSCVGFYRTARFAPVLFAGAVAEQLIARERVDVAATIGTDPARPALPSRGELETVALCLSLEQPAAVAGLLATRPASREEDQAFAAVMAAVPGCLPAGQPLRTNRPGLRAIVATAAYRIVRERKAA